MSEQHLRLRSPIVREDNRHLTLGLIDVANTRNALPMGLHVFLRTAAMPDREEWQAGITDNGFPLTLDKALDVRKNTGFSPVVCWGSSSGFTFDLCPAVAIASRYQGASERIGNRDLSANFHWSGNALESVIVYAASAVLAKLASGLLYYPQRNQFSTGYEAISLARQLIEVAELD
jgi:hypothetical protein